MNKLKRSRVRDKKQCCKRIEAFLQSIYSTSISINNSQILPFLLDIVRDPIYLSSIVS